MSKKKNKEELMEKDMVDSQYPVQGELQEASEQANEAIEDADADITAIMEKVKALEIEIAEWKDKYLRSMAEFDNYRRRSIEEKSAWIKTATKEMALSVCEVWDNFDRALMQINEEQKEDSFIKGIILIDQQLKSALEKEGVKRIEAVGEDFDPNVHEALAHIPSNYEEGKVAAVIQNGYTMHGILIRPVRVAVSNGAKTFNNEKNNNE